MIDYRFEYIRNQIIDELLVEQQKSKILMEQQKSNDEKIRQLKEDIAVLQEKLQKLEEIEKQPRMNLQQEGKYAVVSYHDKVYYRLGNKTTFSWYIKKGVSVGYPVPTLMMVNDAETERLLEGLYYNHIQVKKEKVSEEPEDIMWKSVALRFGEKLSDVGPDGYYDFTPEEWFDWVVNTYGKGQQVKEVVRESKKWCEENPEKSVEDYLTPQERGNPIHKEVENEIEKLQEKNWYVDTKTNLKPHWEPKPQTPEQTAQSLKEAFVEAQQTENWKELQKLIDEEDNDKNFKNSLDLIKEWGEKNKPPTLYQLIEDWWSDIFCANSMDDMETCIDDLVDRIDKHFIPPSHDTNGYEWNECIRMIREKLR